MSTNILCVIPARLKSTRLAEKALQEINGKPMIQMTYEAACQCPHLSNVIVATDSDRIAAVITGIGGEVAMTPGDIQTGSDRVAFVAKDHPEADVIINLQGDEPLIKPEMLSELCEPFSQDPKPQMATLAYKLLPEEFDDPNFVKVIRDIHHNAIYFSRCPIPYPRSDSPRDTTLHHMGIYAYTREFLTIYTQLPQTSLEKAESLEQLRAIEHGYKIYVKETQHRTLEVNTPEELAAVRAYTQSN